MGCLFLASLPLSGKDSKQKNLTARIGDKLALLILSSQHDPITRLNNSP
jgi:hypothetical protein